MNVYKFGGASICDAERIRNVNNIVKANCGNLIVVVSALGKTTNALEKLLSSFLVSDRVAMRNYLTTISEIHLKIVADLCLDSNLLDKQLSELDSLIFDTPSSMVDKGDYDYWYDAIVCYGELFSSTILSAYLNSQSINTLLIDSRKMLITDGKHREANVNIELSQRCFNDLSTHFKSYDVVVMQGFIAATESGKTTTLGREGSDYSAAIVAVLSGSCSLTIWKDVDGVLNADPRYYPSATLIPQLNYNDAVELAYSGAQIIHPKTIRPLFNNDISLYVRSFLNPAAKGSVINGERSTISQPIIIVKRDQILLTIKPNDFSFVIEESFEQVFVLANRYRQKVNLVQNSAVSISIAVDNSRYFNDFLEELNKHYTVAYNEMLELITIRGDLSDSKVEALIETESEGHIIFLSQRTRRLIRFLRGK